MTENKKMKTTIGVFAGIIINNPRLDVHGKILLRRRTEENSIIPGVSFKGNWELPGGGVMETDVVKIPYDYFRKELKREIKEEIGIDISVDPMPAMYTIPFKSIEGYDVAMVTPVMEKLLIGQNKGDIILVSTYELNRLAGDFKPASKSKEIDGQGLLSGWGKRMHCMALKALTFSPNTKYAEEAKITLEEIQATW